MLKGDLLHRQGQGKAALLEQMVAPQIAAVEQVPVNLGNVVPLLSNRPTRETNSINLICRNYGRKMG